MSEENPLGQSEEAKLLWQLVGLSYKRKEIGMIRYPESKEDLNTWQVLKDFWSTLYKVKAWGIKSDELYDFVKCNRPFHRAYLIFQKVK